MQGCGEAGVTVIYLSLGGAILLFQAVTWRAAENREGTLGLSLSFSIKFNLLLPFLYGWTTTL